MLNHSRSLNKELLMQNRAVNNRLVMLLVLSAMVLIFAATALAKEPASFKEALALAKAQNKMVVIDFYTDW